MMQECYEAQSKAGKSNLLDFYNPDYREPFICPYHNCTTDGGWCWECAVENYGYDEAKRIHDAEDKLK